MLHESLKAEKFAFCAHAGLAMLFFTSAAGYTVAMILTFPFLIFPGPLGMAFWFNFWFDLAISFTGLFGFLWHVFACKEHLDSIRRLRDGTDFGI